jgi:hypothetical protein
MCAKKRLGKGLSIAAMFFFMVMTSSVLMTGQIAAPRVSHGIVSDWTHHHMLFPISTDGSVMARIQSDPRWVQNWYLRHPETWWPERPPEPGKTYEGSRRDWSLSLVESTWMSGFEPLFNYSFVIGPDSGYGNLNTMDLGNGEYLATSGTLNVTSGQEVGMYSLYPGGPTEIDSPDGYFLYDNVLYPSVDPGVDNGGLLFTGNGLEINIFGDGPDDYQFYANSGYNNYGTQFTGKAAPGAGQTYPAKFVFDVTAAPSCANDYVVIGIPANPAAGSQANILGVNNLYSSQGTSTPTPPCGTNGPTVMFAYASGTGQVPASVVISQSGKQIAYIEDLLTGSSYFHVLTLATTGTNGTGATAAVVPGSAGGNNAVDQRVLLSPDGGTTDQSSTSTVFVVYTPNDANDVAYATTSSMAGNGSGYLYKIGNVFNGSATPTVVWSVPINAVPSTPVYDSVSNKVFFTDGSGRIDYVTDTGSSPSVVYGPVVASGATSENPVIVDSTNQMVYATFNSNGTNALVVQAPTSMASTISAAVGVASTAYTAPNGLDFNNAWYTGSGTPLLYVAGTGAGTVPTLYSIGFNGTGVMNSSANHPIAALATGTADSSPVTEFYNASLQKDYLFVGVTANCIATSDGGTGGCVMSLDITEGFPAVNTNSTALAATGGITGITVDNESSLTEASSIYYATKAGGDLVKATQSGLN